MKKVFTALAFLMLSLHALSQVNANGTSGNMIIISLGANNTIINNTALDAWTYANYNKTENNGIGANADIAVITRKYDFGLDGNISSPYSMADLYWGMRISSRQAAVTLYLNLKIGGFEAIYRDIVPANYNPPEGSAGKEFQLHYDATYIGIESRNYFNFLIFKSGKGRKGISYNSGFYFEFGYEPWQGDWEYGYYTGEGRYSQFHGTKVYGIPQLNDVFINAGLFFGIGS